MELATARCAGFRARGCGHGSDTLWLAAQGRRVTAVDFSAAALAQGRSTAEAAGPDIGERIDWVEADLSTWEPQAGHYDLVVSLYVRVVGSVEATGAPTPAADQVKVSVGAATTALDSGDWELVVAGDRPRAAAGTGVDAVTQARRLD